MQRQKIQNVKMKTTEGEQDAMQKEMFLWHISVSK